MIDFAEPDRARFFDVNRTRIRGWCWGDPDAPPVLLVHGGHDHGRMFDDLAPRIAALGFHAVAIDVRAHGDSGRTASGMVWSASSIDLLEVARVLAEEAGTPGAPIGMIGHSMGGGLVTTAAGTAPERVAWLVVLDSVGPPADAWPDTDPAELATQALDRIVTVLGRRQRVWPTQAEMVDRRANVNHRLPRVAVEHLVTHGSRPVDGGWVWKSDPVFDLGVPDGFSIDVVLAGFGDVTAPMLVLMGSEPDMWSDHTDEEVERRVARFPDARWLAVPDAGHYVHIEQPEIVVDEIASFLRSLGVLAAGGPA